jgi:hypothetical protein
MRDIRGNELRNVPFIILAMNTGDKDLELNELKSRGFVDIVECQGVYNGLEETSWVVFFKSIQNKLDLMSLGQKYKQESILVVDSNRYGSLLFLKDGGKVELGELRCVSKKDVKILSSYTYVPNIGRYFAC